VVRGHTADVAGLPDLFLNPPMTEALHRLVGEIVQAFSGHPAISDWRLVDGAPALSTSGDPDVAVEWLHGILDVARSSGAREPLRFGFGVRDVLAARAVDPLPLREMGVGVDLALDWSPEWRRGAGSEWIEFVAAYARRLFDTPVLLTDIGLESGIGTEDLLRAAHEGGCGGCSGWSLSVMDPTVRRVPPFDLRPDLLAVGLIDLEGQWTDMGASWAEMLGDEPAVMTVPTDFPEVDPEDAARDPEGVAREVFEAWTR
jgi:hypothetical protein